MTLEARLYSAYGYTKTEYPFITIDRQFNTNFINIVFSPDPPYQNNRTLIKYINFVQYASAIVTDYLPTMEAVVAWVEQHTPSTSSFGRGLAINKNEYTIVGCNFESTNVIRLDSEV